MPRPGLDFLLSGTWAASLFASFVGGSFLSEYQSQNVLPLLPSSSIALTSISIPNDDAEEILVESEKTKKPIPKADGNDERENSSWLGLSGAVVSSSSIF